MSLYKLYKYVCIYTSLTRIVMLLQEMFISDKTSYNLNTVTINEGYIYHKRSLSFNIVIFNS